MLAISSIDNLTVFSIVRQINNKKKKPVRQCEDEVHIEIFMIYMYIISSKFTKHHYCSCFPPQYGDTKKATLDLYSSTLLHTFPELVGTLFAQPSHAGIKLCLSISTMFKEVKATIFYHDQPVFKARPSSFHLCR